MAENLPDTNVGNNDYIRREDVKDALQEKVFHNLSDEFYGAMQVLDELPSADVVQVVRCKDCKHYYFADNRIPQEQRYVCEISGEIWNPDDFCSYGKRRKKNE